MHSKVDVMFFRWFTVATIMPLVYFLPLTQEQTTVLTGLVIIVNNIVENPNRNDNNRKE